MSECVTGCGRPTERMLCGRCLGVLRAALGDIGAMDTQLGIVLSKQTVVTESVGQIDGTDKAPLPISRGALKARSILRNRLVGWVRDVADPNPVAGPVCLRCQHRSCGLIRRTSWPNDTLPAMAAWLLSRDGLIAAHVAADDIYEEITEAVAFAQMIVDLPANRTTFAVGPCPEMQCPGEVRAFIPAQRDTPARMECSVCGEVWDTTQWSRLGKRVMAKRGARSAMVDTEAASRLLGVTSRTVRNWVSAGRLENHGDDKRIVVDLAELESVLDAA